MPLYAQGKTGRILYDECLYQAIGGGGPPQLSGYIPEAIEFAGGFEIRDGRVAMARHFV